MGRFNPFLLRYKKEENQVTELLLHVLDETGLAGPFLASLLDQPNLATKNFTMDTQLHRSFPNKVRSRIVLGISANGVLNESSSDLVNGDPDGYFYSSSSEYIVLLEVKVGSAELYSDQLDRHANRVPATPFSEHIPCKWESVVTFFQEQLGSEPEGAKNAYIIRNFLDFLKKQALGLAPDEESLFYRSGRHEKTVRMIHDYLTGLKYQPEFYNKLDPWAMEYKKGGKSHACVDLKLERMVFKFHYTGHKEKMEDKIRDLFGRNYSGSYSDIRSEACVYLEDIAPSDLDKFKTLLEETISLRQQRPGQ
ncbi:hypothetical protein P9G84_31035 [Brevibacillus centrosporus]|uniref:hypothetical protein n=1 Tax=Brevibacillus centrosporus TaxID=54910 RepID=UPI001143869B|nr:hypothetical protein [Brevibacillus centrosporus]MEC2133292.1 hypothetical protein [Brevibacillus centrosporus]GED34463.1 hypothetical protein BCE02nite_56040 [Brevibacillus centrosporus]